MLGGRRASDHFLTVAEVADALKMQPRTLWRKYLEPEDGPRLLPYYDFAGEIRIAVEDFERFKRECFRDRDSTKAS